MSHTKWIEQNLEGVRGMMKNLSQHLPGRTEEYHKNQVRMADDLAEIFTSV
jgi:hypothetical protein